MAKTTVTYWNTLLEHNGFEHTELEHDGLEHQQWEVIENSDGLLEQLTLAMDEHTGDYTRLTRFKPGADTAGFGANSHDYPEEIFIVKGRLYDHAFDRWLECGDYASRPPGEVHGPFKTDEECIVLEISYPSQSITNAKQ